MELKELFKKRFEKLYKGNRLLAIQLDGFTHAVIFDNGKRDSQVHKEVYSSFVGKEEAQIHGINSNKTCELFKDVSNTAYQNNAQEIVYVLPNER